MSNLYFHSSSILGLTREQLAEKLYDIGVPKRELKMRVSQLWSWIYHRGTTSFSEMTNIAKSLRQLMADNFTLERPKIVKVQRSNDGTIKWLLELSPKSERDKNSQVELVYIPDGEKGTLCVSSQIGCTLNCSFCHTGTQKLVRNLTASEITAQVLIARDYLNEWPNFNDSPTINKSNRIVRNIVLMGMGEPLYNFDNVKQAINIISDDAGIAISKRRITLSTSGVVPLIKRCGEEIGCMLAISLHATTNQVRDILVPLNKKYSINELLDACRNYPNVVNSKRITFEYVMLKDVNDSIDDAKRLIGLIKGIPSKINLIPFNPWPISPYNCSDWEQIERFAEVINKAGYSSPIRMPRGRDIMAACGQLKSASEKIPAYVTR